MKHFTCVSRFSNIFLSFTFWPLSLVWACLSTIRSLAALTVPSFRQKWCLLSAVTYKEYTYHLPKIFLSTTKNILVTCQEYTYLSLSLAKNKLVTCQEYSCHLPRKLFSLAKNILLLLSLADTMKNWMFGFGRVIFTICSKPDMNLFFKYIFIFIFF